MCQLFFLFFFYLKFLLIILFTNWYFLINSLCLAVISILLFPLQFLLWSVATHARLIELTKAARQKLGRKPSLFFRPMYDPERKRAERRAWKSYRARKSGRKCGKSPRSSAITLSVREIAADYKRALFLCLFGRPGSLIIVST